MSVENNQNNTSNIINEPSFSMSAWVKEWVSLIIQILKNNFKIILLATLVGGVLGITYSFLKKAQMNA